MFTIHRAEKREPERHVAVYEQERTAHDLEGADGEDIVRLHERVHKFAGLGRSATDRWE